MSTIVKAAAHISPALYSRQGTIEKAVKKVHELGKQGVQFATFPETVVPFYPYFSFTVPSGETMRPSMRSTPAEHSQSLCRKYLN